MLNHGLRGTVILLCMLVVGSLLGRSLAYAETKIFRSVGPQETSALASGSTYGTLDVQGTTATVSSALPLNIGVGDAIQYDSNYDMTVDQVVFITQRLNAMTFMVQTASGGAPVATNVSNINWEIYRAYTSLADAAGGTENVGINSLVRNFDPWTVNNLAASGVSWNIACYAGSNPDMSSASFVGWPTTATCRLRIFTPVQPDEVGVSQRHLGRWDAAYYYMKPSSGYCLRLGVAHAQVEGLQFNLGSVTSIDSYLVEVAGGSTENITISESVFFGSTSNYTNHFGLGVVGTGMGIVNIWNNVFHDFVKLNGGDSVGGIYVFSAGSTVNIYNNTLNYCSVGILASAGTIRAINDLTKYCSPGFSGTFDPASDYNISNNASDAPGSNSQNLVSVNFIDQANKDFHIVNTDPFARDRGLTLPQVPSDIDRQARGGIWDIGADEVVLPGTATSTSTPTFSPTLTLPFTYTPTPTVSPTLGMSATPTRTPSFSPTVAGHSATASPTVNTTGTPTMTPTPLVAMVLTPIPNNLHTVTITPTVIPRATFTPSNPENPAPWFVTHNVLRGPDINRGMSVVIRSEREQHVLIQFRDQQGRKVCTLADQTIPAGRFQTVWKGVDEDGRAVRSGVYLMYIKTDTFEGKCKIAVIR